MIKQYTVSYLVNWYRCTRVDNHDNMRISQNRCICMSLTQNHTEQWRRRCSSLWIIGGFVSIIAMFHSMFTYCSLIWTQPPNPLSDYVLVVFTPPCLPSPCSTDGPAADHTVEKKCRGPESDLRAPAAVRLLLSCRVRRGQQLPLLVCIQAHWVIAGLCRFTGRSQSHVFIL